MIVLVTGASGFLGGRLVELLVDQLQDAELRITVRPQSSLSHLQHLVSSKRVHVFCIQSLEDEQGLAKALKDVNYIFHCAAASSDWTTDADFEASNVRGVEVLCKLASNLRTLRRFVHVSTADVYGYPDKMVDETYDLVETHLPYNRSKVRGEKIVWDYYNKHNMPVTVVRPSNIYGPRGKHFVEPILDTMRTGIAPLISGGRTLSGLVYVDHVAQAMIDAAFSSNTLGEAYNLCDEPAVTWGEYYQKLSQASGISTKWIAMPFWLCYFFAYILEWIYFMLGKYDSRPLLTRHAVMLLGKSGHVDTSKARRHIGYKQPVTFDEGVRKSVEWYKSVRNIK